MIKIYRLSKETFIIAALRSNALTSVRFGICPEIISEKIGSDYITFSNLIQHDVGMEYEFMNFMEDDYDYLSLPQTASKFKEAFSHIGAIKIPALEAISFTSAQKINPEEKLTFLFGVDRNVTCTYKGSVVFDLRQALAQPYTQDKKTISCYQALYYVCKSDPERVKLLYADSLRDHYRKEIETEVHSYGIVLNSCLTYARELTDNKEIQLDFINDVPIVFNYPVGNTIYIRTNKHIPLKSEIEIGLKQNNSIMIKIPLLVYEKTAVSFNRFEYRCHPPYFENYVHQNILRLEKFLRHGLINHF